MPNPIAPLVRTISNREAQKEARRLFTQIEKKGKKVPAWMRVMANCEDILAGFWQMFTATMDNKPVNRALKWKIAYRVSQLNRCAFCVDVSKLKLEEFGVGEKELASLDQDLKPKEKAALAFAEEVTQHAYNVKPTTFKNLKKYFSDEQIVEITSVIGLFNFINRFNDALRILPQPK